MEKDMELKLKATQVDRQVTKRVPESTMFAASCSPCEGGPGLCPALSGLWSGPRPVRQPAKICSLLPPSSSSRSSATVTSARCFSVSWALGCRERGDEDSRNTEETEEAQRLNDWKEREGGRQEG